MGVRRAVVVPAMAVLFGVTSVARADAQGDLEKAHNAYVAHKYPDAEKRLRELLDPKSSQLKDPDAVADARMYLGAVLIAENKKDDAGVQFEQLLLDKPDYQPDPLRVSVAAIDALIDARSRLRDKLSAMQAEKVKVAQEEKAKADAERLRAASRLALLERLASEEVVVYRSSRWVAAVPFGVGQFQAGQNALGAAFLAGEGVLAVGSIVSAVMTVVRVGQASDALQQGLPSVAAQYNGQAQSWSLAGNLFSGGFALAAVAGIVHAEVTFLPERVEIRKRELPPVALSPMVGPLLGVQGVFR